MIFDGIHHDWCDNHLHGANTIVWSNTAVFRYSSSSTTAVSFIDTTYIKYNIFSSSILQIMPQILYSCTEYQVRQKQQVLDEYLVPVGVPNIFE